MLDLQAVVQAFGKEGKNRVQRKKAIAPFWIVVTSQEKLNEIVDALDSKKIELARLQDRFRIPIDLKQSDIPEITGKRILEKNDKSRASLVALYNANEGRLKTFSTLERTSRDVSMNQKDFVNLYPYLPYQIDLSIDIVAGLRLKRGAHRHIGGSNRTIIKQAQEMMINPSTMLADSPVGTLVTLDKMYELLYLGNLLPSETTREVDGVPKLLPANEMALKVAKAIALLESVKDLPRTVHNISVVLHPSVESESIKKEVERALKALEQAQVIRDSEEGYKLLTVQEKKWDTTRKGLEPKPADRNRIMREVFREIFTDPRVKSYRFKNLRAFKMSLSVEGETVDTDGQVPLNIFVADDPEDKTSSSEEARGNSVSKQDEIFWVVTFNEEIHQLFHELFRSREMVSTHERHAAQGKLTPEEASCLAEEKVRRDRNQRLLRSKLAEVLQSGSGFFRGVERDGSSLGQALPEVFHKLLDLKAKSMNKEIDITESHLGCADVLQFDDAKLCLFLERLNLTDSIYARVLKGVWEELTDLGQVGSLLRFEAKLQEFIAEERTKYQTERKKPHLPGFLPDQFETEAGESEFWEIIETQILQAFHFFAKDQAEQGRDESFFASETVKGFQVLDIMTRRYDVVATNPPYMARRNMDTMMARVLQKDYPNSKGDLYTAFIERCAEFLGDNGQLAMITQQSFMFISSYEKMRSELLDGYAIESMCHVGPRAFDAISGEKVNTTLFVLRREADATKREEAVGTYFRLVKEPDGESKQRRFEEALGRLKLGENDPIVYGYRQRGFDAIPGSPWVYWLRSSIRDLFSMHRHLGEFESVKEGINTLVIMNALSASAGKWLLMLASMQQAVCPIL